MRSLWGAGRSDRDGRPQPSTTVDGMRAPLTLAGKVPRHDGDQNMRFGS